MVGGRGAWRCHRMEGLQGLVDPFAAEAFTYGVAEAPIFCGKIGGSLLIKSGLTGLGPAGLFGCAQAQHDFGVARGVLLVLVAFVVYERVMVNDSIPVVDDSRTARIFARTEANIDEQIPTDAPGWIVARYEQLVGSCGGA